MSEQPLNNLRHNFSQFFLDRYNNFPQGKYVSLILVRQTESEAIFRTEGSGEPLNVEYVHASDVDDDTQNPIIQRVVISKRKQTAVERRQGRELLRRFELLGKTVDKNKEEHDCALNRNAPCEKCMDCLIYGFAAGGGGAQKARVITDDAYSLHEARVVRDKRQFNALFDNSTMRDPISGAPSTSIGTDEYVRPQTTFLDIETLHDLSLDEFIYVCGNVLRSSRYGAISSRIGSVHNTIASVVFSDCELFSNLELTQMVYRLLRGDQSELAYPLRVPTVTKAVWEATNELLKKVAGQTTPLSPGGIDSLVNDVTTIYQNEAVLRDVLTAATGTYGK